MRLHSIPAALSLLSALACVDEDASSSQEWLRDIVTLGHQRPTTADPVVATLAPGDVFMFQGRYHFVPSGNGPTMSWFAPANVDDIPLLFSGNTIRVNRNGQSSLARVIGLRPNNQLYFAAQANSPFTHSFHVVPWTAWGPRASQVASCAGEVEEQREECIADTLGEHSFCGPASADELGECASNQDYAVSDSLGALPRDPLEFECMLPHGYTTFMGGAEVIYTDPYGEEHDCVFYGTVSQEPGEIGCVTVYDGTLDCGGVVFGICTDPQAVGTVF